MKYLSYNINNKKDDNIYNYIKNQKADIVSLQEAQYFNNDIYMKNKYNIYNNCGIDNNKQYTTLLLIDKSYEIINIIYTETHKRGIICAKIKKNNMIYIILSIHLEHFDGNSIIYIDNNTIDKTLKEFEMLINKVGYENNSNIIIIGDGNEFYEKINNNYFTLNNNIIYITNNKDKTCCDNDGYKYIADIIAINNNNNNTAKQNNNNNNKFYIDKNIKYSDHYPIIYIDNNMYYKYLKYKNKYLQLKLKLNNI
jgi:exonuclease III